MMNTKLSTSHALKTDRRKLQRFESHRTVKFTEHSSGSIVSLTRILDVSHTGLRLLVRERLKPTTVLRLDFPPTHNERSFSVKGVVVWCTESLIYNHHYDCGVVFLYAPANTADIIRGSLSF